MLVFYSICFFFSSRRRHTRCLSDWSSDVCSSDLASAGGHLVALLATSGGVTELEGDGGNKDVSSKVSAVIDFFGPTDLRSEERRVGKESRCRGWRARVKKTEGSKGKIYVQHAVVN